MRFKDWTGQRFGKLVVESYEQRIIKPGKQWIKVIIWTCRCDCGNTREVKSGRLTKRPPTSCVECAAQSNEAAASRQRMRTRLPKCETSPYMHNYESYREGFTPEQRARYEELLRGRRGVRVEAEAVDVVMREPEPGVCCERCLRDEPMPPEPLEDEAEQETVFEEGLKGFKRGLREAVSY